MSSPESHHAVFGHATSPAVEAARQFVAVALGKASAALERLAVNLLPHVVKAEAHEPRLEFHCEAGAPEGALYLDGRLVAHLQGVTRL